MQTENVFDEARRAVEESGGSISIPKLQPHVEDELATESPTAYMGGNEEPQAKSRPLKAGDLVALNGQPYKIKRVTPKDLVLRRLSQQMFDALVAQARRRGQ